MNNITTTKTNLLKTKIASIEALCNTEKLYVNHLHEIKMCLRNLDNAKLILKSNIGEGQIDLIVYSQTKKALLEEVEKLYIAKLEEIRKTIANIKVEGI